MKFAQGSEKTLSEMDGFGQSRYAHIPDLDSNEWTVQPWGVDPAAPENRTLEISVVRKSNAHGRLSYGWPGPEKHIIAQSNAYGTPPQALWPKFVQMAQEFCDELGP